MLIIFIFHHKHHGRVHTVVDNTTVSVCLTLAKLVLQAYYKLQTVAMYCGTSEVGM